MFDWRTRPRDPALQRVPRGLQPQESAQLRGSLTGDQPGEGGHNFQDLSQEINQVGS